MGRAKNPCILNAGPRVYSSRPDLFIDREAVHFIDNTGALYGLHHAYSKDLDSAELIHSYYALTVALGCRTWWAYIPSAANIADYPSRGKDDELRAAFDCAKAEGAQRGEPVCTEREPFDIRWPEFGADWSETFTTTLRKFGTSRLARSAKNAIKEVDRAVEHARQAYQTFTRKSTKLGRKRMREHE